MRLPNFIIIFALILGTLSSCRPDPTFPDEPTLEFKSFTQTTDGNGQNVANFIMRFTDGDGNVGLEQSDTTGVFCPDTCFYHYNLFCNYYEKQEGEWVHYSYENEDILVPFYYRVPRVIPNGQNPSLEGDIDIFMNTYFLPTSYDTCRFEAFLVDRDLNHSNVIMSREFIKP